MGLLRIIYRDEHYVAISKPESLLVHRSRQARDHVFALQLLRDQVGRFVYPVHRLDRPTSGVLIFGFTSEAAAALCRLFEERQVHKTYLALVRGITQEQETIDYPLYDDDGETMREAISAYTRLETVQLDDHINDRTRPDYSLVAVVPQTGRTHQIRRHFHHIHHPIIGDTTHGDGIHNRYFREKFSLYRLMLHASCIRFTHPFTNQLLTITAPLPEEFGELFDHCGWDDARKKIMRLHQPGMAGSDVAS
jgi:tRNA pseudouridine65 synthase